MGKKQTQYLAKWQRHCKGKVRPGTGHEGPEGEYKHSSTLSLNSAPDGDGWSKPPRPLYPRERLDTHCKGGWVGPRAGLDGFRNSRLLPGFDRRTVQPVTTTPSVLLYSARNSAIQHVDDWRIPWKIPFSKARSEFWIQYHDRGNCTLLLFLDSRQKE